jgi:hypothetical protein
LNLELFTCKAGTLLLEPHLQSIFTLVTFGDGVLGTINLGWPRMTILPILASQVARITGVSHRTQPSTDFLIRYKSSSIEEGKSPPQVILARMDMYKQK